MENRRELDYVKEGPNFPMALIAVEGICWFNTSICFSFSLPLVLGGLSFLRLPYH